MHVPPDMAFKTSDHCGGIADEYSNGALRAMGSYPMARRRRAGAAQHLPQSVRYQQVRVLVLHQQKYKKFQLACGYCKDVNRVSGSKSLRQAKENVVGITLHRFGLTRERDPLPQVELVERVYDQKIRCARSILRAAATESSLYPEVINLERVFTYLVR